MRITILGASFDNNNLGVSALAIGIVTCIAKAFPDAEISLLDYARQPTLFHFPYDGRVIPIQTVMMRMKPYPANNIVFLVMYALVLRLIPSKSIREWVISKNSVLRHIQEADAVVAIAGGDSFSDIYGLRRLVDMSLPQILVILLGKKLTLLPQTLGPFTGITAKVAARFILGRADSVYSRDHEGLHEIQAMLGDRIEPGRLRFCYDLGFVVEPHPPVSLDVAGISIEERVETPLVGLNISGLLFMGGYSRKDTFGFRDRYIDFSHRIIDFLICTKKVRVLLIPHVIGTDAESDSPISAEIYEKLKDQYGDKIGLVRGMYTTPEIKYVIGKCDFFIGARMHACIGALSQGIPAVSVAYSRKFIGVLGAIGAGQLVVDPRILGTAEMLQIVGDRFDRRAELRALLDAKMPTVKRTILNLIPEICTSAVPEVNYPHVPEQLQQT